MNVCSPASKGHRSSRRVWSLSFFFFFRGHLSSLATLSGHVACLGRRPPPDCPARLPSVCRGFGEGFLQQAANPPATSSQHPRHKQTNSNTAGRSPRTSSPPHDCLFFPDRSPASANLFPPSLKHCSAYGRGGDGSAKTVNCRRINLPGQVNPPPSSFSPPHPNPSFQALSAPLTVRTSFARSF